MQADHYSSHLLMNDDSTERKHINMCKRIINIYQKLYFVVMWRLLSVFLIVIQIVVTLQITSTDESIGSTTGNPNGLVLNQTYYFEPSCNCSSNQIITNITGNELKDLYSQAYILFPVITCLKAFDLTCMLVVDIFVWKSLGEVKCKTRFVDDSDGNKYVVRAFLTIVIAIIIVIIQYDKSSRQLNITMFKTGSEYYYKCDYSYVPVATIGYDFPTPMMDPYQNCSSSCAYQIRNQNNNNNKLYVDCVHINNPNDIGYIAYVNIQKIFDRISDLSLTFIVTSIGGFLANILHVFLHATICCGQTN